MAEDHIVVSIKGVHALAESATLFVIPLGDGEVVPMYGAEIVELEGGKFLARMFNGERWIQEVLEIREMFGVPTLLVASS